MRCWEARLFTVPAHIGSDGYGWSDVISVVGSYSILGGYAGGILVGALRMRMLGLPVTPLMDMAAPGLALGAVVGRIGDLAIVEHLGSPTNFLLGYTVKPGYDLASQHDALECDTLSALDGICGTYHHTALYDMLGAAVLLGVLLVLRRRWTTIRYGQLFAIWMLWYGLQRFLIDFTRLSATESVDAAIADRVMGPLTGSQWGALGLAVLGLIALVLAHRRNPVVSDIEDARYRGEPDGEEPDGEDPSGDDPLVTEPVAQEEPGDGAEIPTEDRVAAPSGPEPDLSDSPTDGSPPAD